MSDEEHVGATSASREEIEVDERGTGMELETGIGTEEGRTGSPIAIATARDADVPDRHGRERVGSRERDLHTEPAPVPSQSRYPLNSRRLTAWHLRTLARTLGLPATGSADQLRQCIEGIVQREHDYHNVVVIVQENLKTEHVMMLADSEGEFLQSEPVYRDAPLRLTRAVEDVEVIQGQQRQLDEANQVIEAALAKQGEQAQMIVELQQTLHETEERMRHHRLTEGSNCDTKEPSGRDAVQDFQRPRRTWAPATICGITPSQ